MYKSCVIIINHHNATTKTTDVNTRGAQDKINTKIVYTHT